MRLQQLNELAAQRGIFRGDAIYERCLFGRGLVEQRVRTRRRRAETGHWRRWAWRERWRAATRLGKK